jgi:antitoxin HicB
MKTVDEYLDLPYRVILLPDKDEDGNEGFVAEVEELPGCYSQGRTVEEAYRNVRDAMVGWISVALADGQSIPEPRELISYSGKFVVRLPQTLHEELVRAAEREGVSLNQFVSAVLSSAVGWRQPRHRPAVSRAARSGRLS